MTDANAEVIWINRLHGVYANQVASLTLCGSDSTYYLQVKSLNGNIYDTELNTSRDPRNPVSVDDIQSRLEAATGLKSSDERLGVNQR